jgi:hypothetical protein
VKVHVYAALNVTGISDPIILSVDREMVNGPIYVADVLPKLVSWSKQTVGPRHIWQQDGARPHTSAVARAWLNGSADVNDVIGPDHWPPQSPDLSVIENMWSYLADQVAKRRPVTREQLVQAIQAEFAAVTPAMCHTLVRTVPGRLAAVIANGGLPIVV